MKNFLKSLRRKRKSINVTWDLNDLYDMNDGSEEAFQRLADWFDEYEEIIREFDRTRR